MRTLGAALCAAVVFSLVGLARAGEPLTKAEADFVEVTVKGVVPTEEGHAVVLAPKAGAPLLPVFIGPCEANAIQMRLDKQTAPRRSNTSLGRIYLLQGDKTIQLDARPSDSIALALGAGAPINVAKHVLDKAGLKAGEKDNKENPEPRPL